VTGIDKLDGQIAKLAAQDSSIVGELAALRQDVNRRILLRDARSLLAADATAAAKTKSAKELAAKAASAKKTPTPPVRRRFDAAGWLMFRPGVDDFSPFRVVKGGRLLYYVTCRNGRYDLQDFVGREVGLRGSIERPASAAVRVVDTDRLVILSSGR